MRSIVFLSVEGSRICPARVSFDIRREFAGDGVVLIMVTEGIEEQTDYGPKHSLETAMICWQPLMTSVYQAGRLS